MESTGEGEAFAGKRRNTRDHHTEEVRATWEGIGDEGKRTAQQGEGQQ